MLKRDRQRQILKIIETRGQANVKDLARSLLVSDMTIRRDLHELHQKGLVERSHGGAVTSDHTYLLFEPPLLIRTRSQIAEKQLIAKIVARLVKPGEKIYLGAGSTTYWISKALTEGPNLGKLTVFTNAIPNAMLLSQSPDIEIVVVGGYLRRHEYSLLGHFAESVVRDLHLDKAILGIRGIHPEHGLTSEYTNERMTDRSFMGTSDNIIIAADHSKFGYVSTSHTAPVTIARTIVTTSSASVEMVAAIQALGVEVILADRVDEANEP